MTSHHSPPPSQYEPLRFPPYAFVPGHFPHPVRDEAGHSFGSRRRYGAPPLELDFREHKEWRFVLDLLGRGYYWEAHEGLEDWWHQCEPQDWRRPLFQGLLHLAAAGVKVRQGQPGGVHSHALKAVKRLEESVLLRLELPIDGPIPALRESRLIFLGLPVMELVEAAHQVGLKAQVLKAAHPLLPVEPVLPLAPLLA